MGLDKPLEKAEKAVDSAKSATKNLCPWLEPPFKCPQCNVYCDAEVDYVREQAIPVKIWRCTECNSRFYRHRD